MARIPKFTSIKVEREFWGSHDAIEVLGERGWKISEPGGTYVTSVYVAKVGARGALIRVPREWLASIRRKEGSKDQSTGQGKAPGNGAGLNRL